MWKSAPQNLEKVNNSANSRHVLKETTDDSAFRKVDFGILLYKTLPLNVCIRIWNYEIQWDKELESLLNLQVCGNHNVCWAFNQKTRFRGLSVTSFFFLMANHDVRKLCQFLHSHTLVSASLFCQYLLPQLLPAKVQQTLMPSFISCLPLNSNSTTGFCCWKGMDSLDLNNLVVLISFCGDWVEFLWVFLRLFMSSL